MNEKNDYLLNADLAFDNKQYEQALGWYQKVLEITPDDSWSLSRAGAICVPLGKYQQALKYFGHLKELDPDNGDNDFNYGNACFFNKDNVSAFASYVEAENKGCSQDVLPRLYYQMALLCSMRQDVKSALIYFTKCEKADPSGMISLNPDLISEKLKLYLFTEDLTNALKCAAQLVAIQPTLFKNYMVYYSILMGKQKYDQAEKILKDAQTYAELNSEERVTLLLQMAALYVAEAQSRTNDSELYFRKAEEILEKRINAAELPEKQLVNVLMTLADVYLKHGKYTSSIKCLQYLLKGSLKSGTVKQEQQASYHYDLSSDEIEAMIQADTELIQQKIDTGEISQDLGLYAEMEYDEYGNLVPSYDESLFAFLNEKEGRQPAAQPPQRERAAFDLSSTEREKIYFTLLSCYLEMDDFKSAGKYADILKYSNNKYYNYYGIYTGALILRKTSRNADLVNRKYAEAIAFFRNQSFADHSDILPVIFRARLYAEQGKLEKAKELAMLLSDNDKASVMQYINTCKR